MKRLLMVTTVATTLRAFLLPFAAHFRAKGWQVDAMAQGVSECSVCQEVFDQNWEIAWSRNPLDLKNLVAAPQQIRNVLMRQEYDIVHVHTPVAAFVTRYALRNLRQELKVVYTAHGFHFYRGGKPLKNAIFLALEKLAGSWTDHLIVINQEDAAAAKRYRFLPPERIHYMPGIGVDMDYYNPTAVSEQMVAAIRQELNLSPDNVLFLCIAELIPRKRHRDVLHALVRLARPKIHLAFAGTGSLAAEIQQMSAELGVDKQVHFLGCRHDIPALIRTSIATLLVSEQEGLPRSVMESLCLEVPVIGTNIRGTRDLLDGLGLLVEIGDVEALAQAMAWVLDHPEAARLIGKQGKSRMTDYDLRSILRQYEALYDKALADRYCEIYSY